MKRALKSPLALRVVVIVMLAGAWEAIARLLITTIGTSGEPIFPSIEYLASHAFLQLSDFWQGGLGVPAPSNGGRETYMGAILALITASRISLTRLVLGIVIGLTAGLLAGFLVSASGVARSMINAPMHILRMVPFLALAPLFEVWFGKSDLGALLFIAYGSAVVSFVGAGHAVGLIPPVMVARAKTQGASRWQIYRWVVIPGSIPALRATVLIVIGLGWTLDVAAEMLGVQSGLGVMMEYSLRFAYTGRVIIVAFVYLVYAGISFYAIQWLTGRMIRWHPSQAGAREKRTRKFAAPKGLSIDRAVAIGAAPTVATDPQGGAPEV
jgi:sulfonate transport system permease protein